MTTIREGRLRGLLLAAVVPVSVAFSSSPAAEAAAAADGDAQVDSSAAGLLVFAPLAVGAALIVSLVLVRRQQRKERRHLVKMLLTDGLTGLSNRRRLDNDLDGCAEATVPVAVAMIDIDRFKQLNDRQGHVIGDLVLRRVAEGIASKVRSTDVVYRYGGEEFCVLLPGASEENARLVIERVRAHVETLDFSDIGESVTVSAGVACGPGQAAREFLDEADRALFSAKDAGRNRVFVASASD